METGPTGNQTRGRGATINPASRFEALHYELEDWCEPDSEPRSVRTQYLKDDSRTIISYNNSPDVGFDASLNPYRGCEHGCAYCYARPTHEYLGFSAGIDFESRIMVKPKAAALLAAELARPSWIPQHLALSGVTDAYQPIERKLQITRSCLQVSGGVPQPGFCSNKESLGHQGRGLSRRVGQRRSLSSIGLDYDSRPEARSNIGASRVDSVAPARRDCQAPCVRCPGRR